MDKAGNFIGYAFFDGKNLSEMLVERGLAKVNQFSAGKSKYQAALNGAQDRARAEKLKIWTLPENAVDATSALLDGGKSPDDEEGGADFDDADGKAPGDLPPRTIQYKDVLVTEMSGDLKFYAQLADQGPKLERMMADLRTELSSNPPVTGSYSARKGDLCAALYTADNQWYRAKVESVKSRDRCDVVYVDFGNRETIETTRLATLPSSFHHMAPGTKEYRLAYIKLPEDPADAEAAVNFVGQQILAAGQRLLLNVEYRTAGQEHATLTTPTDKQDLGKMLVAQGYATVEPKRDRRLQTIVQEYKQSQDTAKTSRVRWHVARIFGHPPPYCYAYPGEVYGKCGLPEPSGFRISDPLRDPSLIGFVLDLPRFNKIPFLYDGPPKTIADLIILPPSNLNVPEMRAGGGRNLKHRHKSMKKHWRKKHFRRDLVIYRKRERRRKMAAEKVFRDRLSDNIKDAETFDAKSYVETFLEKVQLNDGRQAPPSILINESSTDSATDKKSVGVAKKSKGPYSHWTELITVEQLYGLPPSKFIDLNAGKPDDEEWQEILRLRRQYDEDFKKKVPKIDDEKKQS